MPALPQEQDLQKNAQIAPPIAQNTTPKQPAATTASAIPTPKQTTPSPQPQLPQVPQQAQPATPPDWESALPNIAKKYGVQEDLIRRVIKQESGGNPNALSPKGAYGVMQLMPETAKRYGIDPRDPVANLDAGTRELVRLLDKYKHYGKALAAYNAGEGVVDRLGGAGGFDRLPAETRNYVNSIMAGYQPPQAAQPGPGQSEIERQAQGQKPLPEWLTNTLLNANKIAQAPVQAGQWMGNQMGGFLETMYGTQGVQPSMQASYDPSGRLQEQFRNPVSGAARGLGETLGETVGNPTNWPFLSGATARPLMQKAISLGFGAQMGQGALSSLEDLYENWDRLSPAERSERIAKTGLATYFTKESLQHGLMPSAKQPQQGRTGTQPTPREVLPETPSTIQRAAPGVQMGPQGAPSVAQEGGPQPVTQAGTTAAKEITGRTQGLGVPSAASAPIEGAGIAAGTGAPSAGEVRPEGPSDVMQRLQQQANEARATGLMPSRRVEPGVSPTGQERRLVDLAKEQMRSVLPGQQTPGEQLSQQIRESQAGPRVPLEMEGQVVSRIMRDPTLFQRFQTSDRRGQDSLKVEVRNQILEEQKSAQRPTGPAQTPAPTAATTAEQPIPGTRPAEAPSNAPREPLQPRPEPVRGPVQQVAQPTQVAPKAPPKPYVPLPASERPRVSAAQMRGEQPPTRPAPEPTLPPAPAERRPSEVAPGVSPTPRPKEASAEQAEAWKETRRAEAAARQSAMREEAPYKPRLETRSPIGAALDRYLKPTGNYTGDRGAELVRAVEDVKRQGPVAVKTASEELSNRAQRAESMSKWGQQQMDPERAEFNAEAKAKLHAMELRGGVDPETGKFVAEPSGRWLTEQGVKGGKPAPSLQRVAEPDEAEALNRVRGNKLKEVGTPREMTAEEQTQLKEWESRRDALVEELRQRGQKISSRAMDQLKKYITGIQAFKGTRFISEGGPEVKVGPEGGLQDTGTRLTQAMWNRFMGRPEGAHFKAPGPEEVNSRIKELDKEAKWSRDLAKELGSAAPEAKPSVKEAPPPRATAPSVPTETPTEKADLLGSRGATKPVPAAEAAPKASEKAPEKAVEAPKAQPRPIEAPRAIEAPKEAPRPTPAPSERGPVTKSSLTRESLEDIRAQIARMPAGEDRTSLEKRHANIEERFENLTEKMKWAMRSMEAMRKKGEKVHTHKDPKTGKVYTDTLAELEMRVLKLGQERAGIINEEIPSLKAAAKALGVAPLAKAPEKQAPTVQKPVEMLTYDTKGEVTGTKTVVPSEAPREEGLQGRAEELQAQRQHLANLINKGFGDSAAARNRLKSIRRIEGEMGIKAPAPIPGVKETLEGAGLLKAAKRTEPRPTAGEREKAVYAPETLKNMESEDLHEKLTKADLSTPLMDKLLTVQPGKTKPLLGEEERNSLARPILKDLESGDLEAHEASKRFNRALEVLVEGRRAASKLEDVAQRHAANAKAFSNAVEIAKGRRLELPKIKEGGFIGRPGGKGLEAAERIRREREAEEKSPFYNMSERVVREQWPGGPTAKASPKDIAGMLANAGVSRNELKWSDVDSYLLKAQKEGRQVTQKEVLDYLKERNPRVEVTEKAQTKLSSEATKQYTDAVAKADQAFEHAKATIRQELGYNDSAAGAILNTYENWLERNDNRATPVSFENYIKDLEPSPEGGIKLSEIVKNTKVMEALRAHADASDAETDLHMRLDEGQSELSPRYESYTLAGGKNYREVLLRIPVKEPTSTARLGPIEDLADPSHPEHAEWQDEEGVMHGMGRYRAETLNEPGRYIHGGTPDAVRENLHTDAKYKEAYTSPHFDEPNIVAHLRLKDRVDADGKKTLFIEEVQSDWDRELREQAKKGDEHTAIERDFGRRGAPDMPFTQGHWLELAMKHVLKEAANKGYDRVAWTTGEQQASRYNLRKVADEFRLYENLDSANPYSFSALKDGVVVPGSIRHFESREQLAELEGMIGKANAEKLRTIEPQSGTNLRQLKSEGFKIGGEHHLQLYDRMMPQFMEKYGKKWGAKVDKADVQTAEKTIEPTAGQLNKFMEEHGLKYRSEFDRYSATHMKEIDAWREKLGLGTRFDSAKVHSMDIPTGMRDVLQKPLRMIGGSQAGVFSPGGKKVPSKRATEAKELREAIDKNRPHEIAEKLDAFVKGLPKGSVDERIRMASEAVKSEPSTGPDRIKQGFANAHANLRTLSSWYWNGEKNGLKLRDALKGNTDPKKGFKEALGRYNETYNIAASDGHAIVTNIRNAHEQPILDAIHVGMDTGFDKELLQKAVDNKKLPERLRKAAYLAQRLKPEERATAEAAGVFFQEQGEMLSRVGALRHMLENYVPHMIDAESESGQRFMNELRAGVFDTNFRYARQRIHETMFDGAEKGMKYALGIDRAFWDYHRRSVQSISSRAFIKELSDVTQQDNRPALVPGYNSIQAIVPADYNKYPAIREILKANPRLKGEVASFYMFKDNRGARGPVADVSVMQALGIPFNEKTITENDKARMDVSDYKHVEHPDFKQTVYVGKGPDGKPVFYKADLYAHPAIYDDLKNIYEASQFRTNKLTRAALAVTAGSKRLLLKVLPSGFHYSQEGLHSIGHGVNPFKADIWSGKLARESANDPVVRKALRSGLQLHDWDYSDAMEGIKGVRGFEKDFENHLFGKFIPGLKIETFKKQLSKNLATYRTKGYSEDRIYEMTAQQMNNAYGMQNRLFTGRTKFMQDLFRLGALAPDFLESRARFVGSAFRPGGRQQAMALMRLGLYMYGTARVLNAMTNDGDAKWDPKDVFTWHYGGHEFSMRSVLTDAIFAATDLSHFLVSRGALIPRAIFAEGEKAGTPKFIKNRPGAMQGLIRSMAPIVVQRPVMALMRQAYEKKNGPSIAWEAFAGLLEAVAGVREREEQQTAPSRSRSRSLPRLSRPRGVR